MNDYSDLFNTLDDYINDNDKCNDNNKIEYKCLCGNIHKQQIIHDNYKYICEKCGCVLEYDECDFNTYEDKFKSKPNTLNPYNNSIFYPKIYGYNNKFKSLQRLCKWKNHSYTQKELNKSYNIIEKLWDKIDIYVSNKIKNYSKLLYNEYYLKQQIKSKVEIRTGVYIFCIIKTLLHYEIEFDIFDILFSFDYKIIKFNKVIKKLDETLYIHYDLKYYYDIVILYNDISFKDFITKYNNNIVFKKTHKVNINNEKILIGMLYLYIRKSFDKKEFVKVFNISSTTFRKVLKYITIN
jgi:hypothetical protein